MSNYFDISTQTWDIGRRDLHGQRILAFCHVTTPLTPKGKTMSEDRNSRPGIGAFARSGNVTVLAGRALSVVAREASNETRHPHPRFLQALEEAVMSFSDSAREEFLLDAMANGVTAAVLIDVYIPAVARILGDQWCEDKTSFADVTIGSARLQAMVRDLDKTFSNPPAKATVVLIVLQDAYHTLGAMVATSQLRRSGIAVKLLLGQAPHTIPKQLNKLDYDAVFISASLTERLEKLKELVDHTRIVGNGAVPVVIGGSILNEQTDVKTLTGADYTLNDPIEAAQKCGLMNLYANAGHIIPSMEP